MVFFQPSLLVVTEFPKSVDNLATDLVPRPRNGGSEHCSEMMRRDTVLDRKAAHNRSRNIGYGPSPPRVHGRDHPITRDQDRYTVGGPDGQADARISGHQGIATPDTDRRVKKMVGFNRQRCDQPTVDLLAPANRLDFRADRRQQPPHPFLRRVDRCGWPKAEEHPCSGDLETQSAVITNGCQGVGGGHEPNDTIQVPGGGY